MANAFGLRVYNPARGVVSDGGFVAYSGKPVTTGEFSAPVAYGNRFASDDTVRAMRFAGRYYVAVTLDSGAAKHFPQGADLTLRVDVRGTPQAGPGYAGPAGDFDVTPGDGDGTGRTARTNGTLMLVAYAGIGTGVVLPAGLGAWTVVARRGAAATIAQGPGEAPSAPRDRLPAPSSPVDQQPTQ
ncbi:hypothetical protein GCM10010211_53660 [Streptomyces albospinus]|uniref:Uncharacterized protein n=1 Tax=Streptomyces albospinus TaxID=285515 RepID=A0ABQ2VF76_9ACTN|nr:hypothetical protein GCM10010211_53660 [Streptomyces albospinus]